MVKKQLDEIVHTSNLYRIPMQERLAGYLADTTFGDRSFFANSGAEANECAIKTARRFQCAQGHPERWKVVSFERSFHGRTLATLAATGQAKYKDGFGPMPDGFLAIGVGDEAALEEALAAGDVAAVLAEVIQAEGGVRPMPKGFLKKVREACDRHGALLILDEVQTGVARTGTMWAYEGEGITPDVLTTAKGLGGGIPIGACVTRTSIAEAMGPGSHASTFGGNPLACAAGVAVLKTILADQIVDRVAKTGAKFRAGLEEIARERSSVVEVRGRGLLLGVELDRSASEVVERLRVEHKVVAGTAGERVLRLTPPLVIPEDAVERGLEAIRAVLR